MRFEAWEKRLAAIIGAAGRAPFTWGQTDCAMFCAAAVGCLTQRDPGATWRGKYSDEAGALRFIAAAGGLAALAEEGMRAAGIPFERIARAFGQRGDPCLFDGGNGEMLGVIEGETIVGKAKDGLLRFPITHARIVWAVR